MKHKIYEIPGLDSQLVQSGNKNKPIHSTKKIIIAGLTILGLFLAFLWYKQWDRNFLDGEITDKSIAVLPFKNMSGDPEQEYICEGLTEDIILHLSRIKSFDKVIAFRSVITFKDSDKTLNEIARKLKVDIVLTGSFHQSGDQIKINAQLINASNDGHLWSEVYERPIGDILDLHADIAKKIVARFDAEITPQETIRLDKKPTENLEAYILLKKGRHKMWGGDSQDYQAIIDLFKKAIEIDSSLAEAYVDLASAYLYASDFYTGDSSIPVEDPLPLIQKALAMDPELSRGHLVLSNFKMLIEWDFLEAEQHAKQATELDHQDIRAKLQYAYVLAHTGRSQEALPYVKKAVELDPTDGHLLGQLAKFHIYAGNMIRATQIMNEYEFLFPNEPAGGIGQNYLYLNNLDRGIFHLEKDSALPLFNGYLTIAYTKKGQHQKAKQALARLMKMSQEKRFKSVNYSIGLFHSGSGQVEEALDWLEKAYTSHDGELYCLKSEPFFKPLHGHPRYEELLRKIGFPE